MPYKTDKLKLGNPSLDRRVKMLPEQKQEAIDMHKSGVAIRAIARYFKVDKRLIQFIIFPDRQEKNKADRAQRGGSKQYYDKDYHNEKMRDHRRYKYATLTGADNTKYLKSDADKDNQYSQRQERDKAMNRTLKAKQRSLCVDWYIVNHLKARGFSIADIQKYPIVDLMRSHLFLKRLIKSL